MAMLSAAILLAPAFSTVSAQDSEDMGHKTKRLLRWTGRFGESL